MNTIIHPNAMPEHPDAIYIGREHSGRGRGPTFKRSPWANPWNHRHLPGGRAEAVELYRRWLAGDPDAAARLPRGNWHKPTPQEVRDELAGRPLACWCPVGGPCHGHVLAEVAAVQTGRRFVGLELRETWAAVARQRIEAATATRNRAIKMIARYRQTRSARLTIHPTPGSGRPAWIQRRPPRRSTYAGSQL